MQEICPTCFGKPRLTRYLAIGMVFVITAGHIDLSVGSVTGLAGAIAAMMQVRWLPALGVAWGVEWLQPGWPTTLIAAGAAIVIGLSSAFGKASGSRTVGSGIHRYIRRLAHFPRYDLRHYERR